MPHARYTADGGTYRVGRHTFEPDDEHEVDDDLASHLEDVDDFEVIDESGAEAIVETQIQDGVCPWCDEYEGENVGQHASSAHPDEWTAYKEA